MKITLIIRPEDKNLPFCVKPEDYSEFALSLNAELTTKEELVDGFIIWDSCGNPENFILKYGIEAIKRTILFNVSNINALKELEQYSFAGAIDSFNFNCGKEINYIYGLRNILDNPISRISSHSSKNYCLYRGEDGIANLTLSYLKAYKAKHEC